MKTFYEYLIIFWCFYHVVTPAPTTGGASDSTGSHQTEEAGQTTMQFTKHEEKSYNHTANPFTRPSTVSSSTMTPRTFSIPKTTKLLRYKFESVDYDELPPALVSIANDCYGQFIRCIRFRTDHDQICAYNLNSRWYNDYYSPCEVERQNCNYRVYWNYGIYGTTYVNDIIYFNGEGHDCRYYYLRARNEEEMHKLYFGDKGPPDFNNNME